MSQATIIGFMTCNGKPVRMVNCSRFRVASCAARCTRFGALSEGQCDACGVRDPIVYVRKPRMRGLGDLVAACVTWLSGGKAHVVERAVAGVESAVTGKRGGCGCKARKAALNAALPFGKDNTNGD